MEAYFKYREVAQPDVTDFSSEEAELMQALVSFEQNLGNWGKYSKVTWALFLKTFRQCLSHVSTDVSQSYLEALKVKYSQEFDNLIAASR